jgi:uncharacterized protein YecE (DUF72 family)
MHVDCRRFDGDAKRRMRCVWQDRAMATQSDLDFARPPARAHAHIRAGTGGWTYVPWRKNFYPEGLVQRRELEYASRHLTAIEINGTYYGAQKPATYAAWRKETPDGFVFSLKAPRYATERGKLASAGKTIRDFVFGGLAELGDRLGPINWQLPPSRTFDRDDLASFLESLPRDLDGMPMRHVLEVRHASFACEDYLALAREQRVATVFTDSPKYPSLADVTGDFVYARLMCSASSEPAGYAPEALDAWSRRAREWSDGRYPVDLPRIDAAKPAQAPRDVFIYFINGAKERAPAAAMALLDRLGA